MWRLKRGEELWSMVEGGEMMGVGNDGEWKKVRMLREGGSGGYW